MSEKLQSQASKYIEFLQSLSDEERAEINRKVFETAKQEHAEFIEALGEGRCYICQADLAGFDRSKPCMHWLLRPQGFEKSDITAVSEKFSFFQIQAFMRWLANTEGYAKNINDFVEESTGTKVVEVTIRYKNVEWSLSCGTSDLAGHPKSLKGATPHYHLQMRVDGRRFINFNDFHLQFHEADLLQIEAMRHSQDKIKGTFMFGEGMQDVLQKDNIERLIDRATTGDETSSPIHFSTMIFADEGHSINGDEIADLQQEAKRTGKTLTSLVRARLKNVSVSTVITPGSAVVEQAPRKGGRSRGKELDKFE
ncbi:MAG: hypothetical protein QM780_05100 [Hyphomicrobium sp.]|uniref:hypothetical protein n=1 Tax=Hyphomicrobium sp. TaxID=82 RepID=UPI0039E329F2